MTNFDRVMDTPLKKLWKNLAPETIADIISNGDLDCENCPFTEICDLNENQSCNQFILSWLNSKA